MGNVRKKNGLPWGSFSEAIALSSLSQKTAITRNALFHLEDCACFKTRKMGLKFVFSCRGTHKHRHIFFLNEVYIMNKLTRCFCLACCGSNFI